MPANQRSHDDHPVADARQRRRRLLAHVLVFSAAGLLATAIGSPSASAGNGGPKVQAGFFLPAGTATATYTCTGADAATQAIIDAIGLSTFPVETTIISDAVDPAPSPGDGFEMTFRWTFTLPQSLVSTTVGLGTTELNLSNSTDPMSVTTGATGGDVVGHGAPQTVQLGDGTSAISYSEGPFTGDFSRTAAPGDPIVFTPGNTLNSVGVSLLPDPLNFMCTAGNVVPMTLVDQEGVAPPTTTTTTTLPPSTTTTAAVTTTTVAGGQLARTGGVNMPLVVLALALIDIGYLTWSAGQPPKRRRRATATR